jgi:hypothetical protein
MKSSQSIKILKDKKKNLSVDPFMGKDGSLFILPIIQNNHIAN